MDSRTISGPAVSRRWLLGAAGMSTVQVCAVSAAGVLVYKVAADGLGGPKTATPASVGDFHVAYAQGMGATTPDGHVAALPLHRGGVARRMFVDAVNGSDRYNGWSPYPGRRPDGTGRFRQYDARGPGDAASDWGPKRTLVAAERALPALNPGAGDAGVGHQLLLAQGGIYPDLSVAEYGGGNRAAYHYGLSVDYPYVVQSYDPADPWNTARHGRATGDDRPAIRLSTDNAWNFHHFVNNVDGVISNFAFRGLRFLAADGTRFGRAQAAFPWASIDSDNILVENCDLGSCNLAFDNSSFAADKPRWSRNLIIRRCLIDRYYHPGSLLPAVHVSGWVGVVIEDCVFNHCTWADTEEGRYAVAAAGAPSIFTHDLYLAGSSQAPNIVRRCVSIDAAATFLSNRNNVEAYNNVVIDAPMAGGAAGGVNNLQLEQPNGNWFDIHHNLSLGSSPIKGPAIVFAGNPTPASDVAGTGGSFVGVGSVEFEFVTAGERPKTGRRPITIGATAAQSAANAVAAFNAQTDPVVARVTYRLATNANGTVEIRQTPGAGGDPLVVMGTLGTNVGVPDYGFRSGGFGSTNGVPESAIRDNLVVNSGYTDPSHNQATGIVSGAGDGVGGRTSYANFRRNRAYAWGPDREAQQSAQPPRNTVYRWGTGDDANRYSDTSPYTNRQLYRALGYADKRALIAAILAAHERPWALTIQQKVGELFGFDFNVPATAAPAVTAPPASTQAPRVGETIVFPDPALPAGAAIVSATTYAGTVPLAATGKTVNSLALTPAHAGKRISRMVVVAPPGGGPATTLLTEVAAPVRAR